MPDRNETTDKTVLEGKFGSFDRLLARIAGIATVIGLIVAVYFGFRSNDKKAFEVNFTGKLSLISLDAGHAGGIRISYLEKAVNNLTKVVVRVSNTGMVPIERKDIEVPLTFIFTNASILKATIAEMQPENLQVEASFTNNTVTVNNGLLNCGDYFIVEMLVDGDSNWPTAKMRVSGVNKPTILHKEETGEKAICVAFFRLPRPLEYLILILATVSVAVLLLIGVIGVSGFLKGLLSPPKPIAESETTYITEPAAKRILTISIDKLKRDSKVLVILAGAVDNASEWISNPALLAQQLEKNVPKPFLESLSNEPIKLAQEICEETRAKFSRGLANDFYQRLPRGLDRQVRRFLREIKFDNNVPYTDLIEIVNSKAKDEIIKRGGSQSKRSIDWEDLVLGSAFLAAGISLVLTTINAWAILLKQ